MTYEEVLQVMGKTRLDEFAAELAKATNWAISMSDAYDAILEMLEKVEKR